MTVDRSTTRFSWTLIVLLVLISTGLLEAQSIFTVAGGADLDGRPATVFPLRNVTDVAIDHHGNLFVADTDQFRVRKVSAETGLLTTIAGNGVNRSSGDGGPATAASLKPSFLAVGPSGNVYVVDEADPTDRRVRKIDVQTGIITNVEVDVFLPRDLDLDSAGNLYIIDFNLVVRVDARTGVVEIFAGGGSEHGDGGPATAANLGSPQGIVVDESADAVYIAQPIYIRRVDLSTGIISTIASGLGTDLTGLEVDEQGDVYFAEFVSDRVQKVDIRDGTISIVAGTGEEGSFGDGGPATLAGLWRPSGTALDRAGNLYIADSNNGRVRKVDQSGMITTVAGVGTDSGFPFVGDNGPGTAATLFTSLGWDMVSGIALDPDGNLYISDSMNYRVRRLDQTTGTITTVAGTGKKGVWPPDPNEPSTELGLATEVDLQAPQYIAVDSQGNFYFVNIDRVLRVDAVTGSLSRFAGGGSETSDGVPATMIDLGNPNGLAVDAAGNLYIVSRGIRRVDAATGIITTIAGNGVGGFGGDGGPATEASFMGIEGIAIDEAGNIYVADSWNQRVRRIDAETGIITTVIWEPFFQLTGVAVDAEGDIYVTDAEEFSKAVWVCHCLYKKDAATGSFTKLAGFSRASGMQPPPTLLGDNGPASAAELAGPEGVAVTPNGDIYIADTISNRIRVIKRCVDVEPPLLVSPLDGSAGLSTSPGIAWTEAHGAFRYDVYLGTTSPPQEIIASDVETTTFSPSNLSPLTTYHWKVVAKGDPFCEPFRTAASEVWSFTTTSECDEPGDFGTE